MEVFSPLSANDIINKSITIKNLVGLDITTTVSSTAIDAIIDDQVTTEPITIYNVTNTGSLSAMYNSIKWNLYEKSGLNNIEAIVGESSSTSLTAGIIKVITIPRETLKQRLTPSSLTASVSFAVSSTLWYIKDEPVISSSGDRLFRGKLKISTSPTFSPTASTTSIGDVFYNYGVLVFRGSVVGNASLSSSISANYNMRFTTTTSTTAIDLTSVSFRREQQKTKQIIFCRAYNNTHNYSNNPTYRNSDGTIKQDVLDLGNMTFAGTVGVYDNNNNLLAVAKINPVAKKTSEDELIFKLAITY